MNYKRRSGCATSDTTHTHLECYGEHQHSEDEGPEGPVPKHLQEESRSGSKLTLTLTHTLVGEHIYTAVPVYHGCVDLLVLTLRGIQ